MTLIEAIQTARLFNDGWIAIDKDGEIYSYAFKPIIHTSDQWYHPTHRGLDAVCSTPLSGTYKDWLINVDDILV